MGEEIVDKLIPWIHRTNWAVQPLVNRFLERLFIQYFTIRSRVSIWIYKGFYFDRNLRLHIPRILQQQTYRRSLLFKIQRSHRQTLSLQTSWYSYIFFLIKNDFIFIKKWLFYLESISIFTLKDLDSIVSFS